MAEPARSLESWLTPRRVFAGFGLLLLLTLLLVPLPESIDRPHSSYGTDPNGVRGLHDVLDRLGFRAERRLVPMRDTLDASAIYVLISPAVEPTATEVHHLLEAVRAGGGLLTVVSANARLADSLGVQPEAVLLEERGRAVRRDRGVLGAGWIRHVLRRRVTGEDSTAVWDPPASARIFASHVTEDGREPAIVGLPFGQGRIVIAAEPDLFRNEDVREGDAAVRAIRLFEWLRQGGSHGPVVFDEYHQGYGRQASVLGVARRALWQTTGGRVVLQIGAAGLILLLAVGVRPVKPRPRVRIERRSPLEHVGALSRAYAAVGATNRATTLLVRGLRRRHGGARAGTDVSTYLNQLRERYPAARADIEQVAHAIDKPGAGDAASVQAAIQRIEQAITG